MYNTNTPIAFLMQSIHPPIIGQTVRYWGPVPELGEGDWVGVELENPVGDTDGSYCGTVRTELRS